jgi:hypothetical protein
MRKIWIAIIFIAAIGCTQKPTAADVEARLKRSMSEFLYRSVNHDSSKVKFHVKDVTYFTDKEFYECEFNVHMLQAGHDTTALMRARIARDFSKVVRKL